VPRTIPAAPKRSMAALKLLKDKLQALKLKNKPAKEPPKKVVLKMNSKRPAQPEKKLPTKNPRKFYDKDEYLTALCKETFPIFPIGTKLPSGCWAMGDPKDRPTLFQQPARWQVQDPESPYFVPPGLTPKYYTDVDTAPQSVGAEKQGSQSQGSTTLEIPGKPVILKPSAKSWDKPEPTEEEVRQATFAPAVASQERDATKFQKRGRWGNCLIFQGSDINPVGPEVIWSKAQPVNDKAPKVKAIGGLRHLNQSLSRLPVVKQVGAWLYVELKRLLEDKPEYVQRALDHIGKKDCFELPGDMTKDVEKRMRFVLEPLAQDFKEPGHAENTPVNVPLLALWCAAARDPDDQPVQWLISGAPAGLRHPIVDRGIFPTYDPEEDQASGDPENLSTPADSFVNYAGVEEDEDAATEFIRLHKNGFVRECATAAEVEAVLGEKPILSKIGIVKKKRNGKVKSRLVVDTKESGVTAATRKFERSQLPRSLDVAYDVMDLMAAAIRLGLNPEEIEFLIADFKDAFFIVPNRSDERKWFVVKFRGKFYIFLRTTQGSRGAPLTWARVAALITRLTQSVIDVATSRINTYVDDPIIALLGPQSERDLKYAMVLLVWSALGLPLSLEKAVRGRSVTWTSAIFTPGMRCLWVEVKKAIIEDATALTETFLKRNVTPVKELKSLTGKLAHVASIVLTLTPFLSELYAALQSERGSAPPGCIWTKQIHEALLWIQAFLCGTPGELKRCYHLSSYTGTGKQVSLELDASPWGLGGVLLEDGVPVSWFASALSTEELELLGIELGQSSAQQTVEALAALVALRAWHHRWEAHRATIRVRSDSVSALVLALRLKTKGRAPGIIAREIALDVAAAHYAPTVAEHVPGLHNVIPDALSRKYQPGHRYILPNVLQTVPEQLLAPRGKSYFRSLGRPPT
jgi:hypothetical protein